jgi:hypothetical protein
MENVGGVLGGGGAGIGVRRRQCNQSRLQVLCVFSTDIHSSKIVYDQGKLDWAPLVRPEAMCVWHRAVTMIGESFGQ